MSLRGAWAVAAALVVLSACGSRGLRGTPPLVQPRSTAEQALAPGRLVVLAHGGGDDAYPHSTPYAYGESVKAGVDALDMDVQLSADGVLIVHHDDSLERTTDGTGLVRERPYDQLRVLDNAFWFTTSCTCRGRPDSDYVLRGVRTGKRPPPPGYGPEDFVIPRFQDIASRWPDKLLNIEIKGKFPSAVPVAQELASELRRLGRLRSSVVTSFDDRLLQAFSQLAPEVELSPGLDATTAFVTGGRQLPHGMRILQLPVEFNGVEVLTPEIVARAKASGYRIWVWPNDRGWENLEGYRRLLALGVDGLNASQPGQAVLAAKGPVGASGSPPAPPAPSSGSRGSGREPLQ